MVRVKVCGVTRREDLQVVVEAGADAVGFIADVSVDTPREIPVDRAADLAAAAPPFLSTTLVTMAGTTRRVCDLVTTVAPDAVQVYADFAADELAAVRAATGVKVVPVVSVDDPDRARAVDEVADAVLVDSLSDGGGGGTGRTHDWPATRRLVEELASPVVLAGGLTPDNVAEAARAVEPFAVDVASGVEDSGGVKDPEAVGRFVRTAGRGLGVPA
jgi:phosphoribosylanthranilate isomerase